MKLIFFLREVGDFIRDAWDVFVDWLTDLK